MHDVILDGRTKHNNKMNHNNKKKPKGLFYVDWIVKSLIIAGLLAINFLLFANTGSFNIFSSSSLLSLEFLYILSGILIFSVSIVYIVSFSTFLQNILTSIIITLFAIAMFNQFALFNKDSMLVIFLQSYVGDNFGSLFVENSHIFFCAGIGITSFVILALSNRTTISYMLGIILLIFAALSFNIFMNKGSRNGYSTTYVRSIADQKEDGKKFVYIAMPDLTSIYSLQDFIINKSGQDKYNEKVNNAINNIIGFYAKNNFILYPLAYVNNPDPYLNILETYNPNTKNPQDDTMHNVVLKSYWDFEDLSNQNIYIKNNKLYNIFSKAKYDIKAYKSRGIEMCYVNNDIAVSKCTKKKNIPINSENLNASILDKTLLLLAEWIESTGLINDYSLTYKVAKALVDADDIPGLGYTTKKLYVYDSLKTLDLIKEDIIKDKNNNAYFAYMDMPADMYIYDEKCKIKPMSEWYSKDKMSWTVKDDTLNKRIAYLEQVQCLYGSLQNFIDDIKAKNKGNNTVIVLQGVSGIDNLSGKIGKEFIPTFKSNNSVSFAIYDPTKDSFNINYQSCSASNLLKNYLFKKSKCDNLSDFRLQKYAKSIVLKEMEDFHLSKEQINLASSNYSKWYKRWKGQEVPDNDEELEDIAITEIKLREIKVMEKPVVLEKEQEVKSFNKAIEEQNKVKNIAIDEDDDDGDEDKEDLSSTTSSSEEYIEAPVADVSQDNNEETEADETNHEEKVAKPVETKVSIKIIEADEQADAPQNLIPIAKE